MDDATSPGSRTWKSSTSQEDFSFYNSSPSGKRDQNSPGGRRSPHHDEMNRSYTKRVGYDSFSGSPASPKARRASSSSPGSPNAKTKAGREPYAGKQPQIKNVFDILTQTRVLVGMIENVWGFENHTTTLFRQTLPGLCRVHVGKDVYILQGYLLQDVSIGSPVSPNQRRGGPNVFDRHSGVTDGSVQEVYVQHPSAYFPYIILLLKLRWLLRLHSACCELDYKMCSLKNLITGLQTLLLQQHNRSESDGGFKQKHVNHVGSNINLESTLDDMTDQLQRTLGKSWNAFLEFVSTCDPSRSAHGSQMDKLGGRDKPPVVVSNDSLASVIDSIFIANFLRQPRTKVLGRLEGLYADLKMLGIPVPYLPALRGAANLRAWATAKTKPTRKDRQAGGGKQMEKLAQIDFVALTCAVELHEPEVMITDIEIEESADVSMASQLTPDATPQISNFRLNSAESSKPPSASPPAAKVILADRPRLTAPIFEGILAALQHHITFPDGIRERLFNVLTEEYNLTQEQSERVGIATVQNIEGHRLPEHTLLQMDGQEKVRIRNHEAVSNKDCSHLLVSALVPAPSQIGQPTKYMLPPPVSLRTGLPGSAFGSVDMCRSLPNLRGFTAKNNLGRGEFKVALSTGPLTMDPDNNQLRTTGFFIKMPPLKYT